MKNRIPLVLILLAQALSTARAGHVVGAGANEHGQSSVPAGLADVTAIAAGRDHSVALLSGGGAAAWGYPGDHRLEVPANATNLLSADAGTFHTLALRASGEVTGWGFNGEHMLSVPGDSLANGGSPVLDIAGGAYHSLALKGDGTVVGWGYDENHRDHAPPSLVGVVDIDAGRDHSLALKYDGTVVAWGYNADGQATVPAGLAGVTAIAAGGAHNLALKGDGTVAAWGDNGEGQCNVPSSLAGVVAVAAGENFSLALKGDGTVVGWGDNSQGQLNVSAWHQITAIAAGGRHSLGLMSEAGIPVITGPPASQTVLAGGDVTFIVTALGEISGYQWLRNGAPIPGAEGSTLTLSAVGRADAGLYSVVVSNSAGEARSRPAALVVRKLHQLAAPVFADGRMTISFGDPLGSALVLEDLSRYVLQVSEDLSTWRPGETPLQLVAGRIQISEVYDAAAPQRFYRVVEP